MRKLLRKLFKPPIRMASGADAAKLRAELEDLFGRIERDYPIDHPPHGRYWN